MVEEIRNGLLYLKKSGELLGKNNLIYQSAIQGINSKNKPIQKIVLIMNFYLSVGLPKE